MKLVCIHFHFDYKTIFDTSFGNAVDPNICLWITDKIIKFMLERKHIYDVVVVCVCFIHSKIEENMSEYGV